MMKSIVFLALVAFSAATTVYGGIEETIPQELVRPYSYEYPIGFNKVPASYPYSSLYQFLLPYYQKGLLTESFKQFPLNYFSRYFSQYPQGRYPYSGEYSYGSYPYGEKYYGREYPYAAQYPSAGQYYHYASQHYPYAGHYYPYARQFPYGAEYPYMSEYTYQTQYPYGGRYPYSRQLVGEVY